eukprot:scaffold35834_cov48-Phaeocystis_antarctica.AAC.1
MTLSSQQHHHRIRHTRITASIVTAWEWDGNAPMSVGGDGRDRGSDDRPKEPTSGRSPPPHATDDMQRWSERD